MSFLIRKPGVLSTIQDLGRYGYQSLGISPAGALDYRSAMLANQMLGNDLNAAVVEQNIQGLTFESLKDTFIATTGANMPFQINGNSIPIGRGIAISKGDIVEFGNTAENMRTYLAVSGGFKVQDVLGSASTHTRSNMGGYDGRALKKGDHLFVNNGVADELPKVLVKPLVYLDTTIRLIKGPNYEDFTDESIEKLLTSTYQISKNNDRMGIRLEGEELATTSGIHDILSEPTQIGNVQVPKNGQPIILLSDRQTTGGYTRIATVAKVDIPKIVQLRPGKKITFELIDLKTASDLYQADLTNIKNKDYLTNDTDFEYYRRIKAERVKKLLMR